MDSITCQTEYNLIPIDSVDSDYCENNNLCVSPINSWDSQWSAIYINWVQHVWAWIIDITIPEEISWDYNNDTENDTFNLFVSWYNVDTAYIEWIINTQKTLPNEQDFNNIITWLIPLLVPWFVIILFLYFVFRFIKKII